MPAFTVDFNGEGGTIGFYSIIYITIITVDVLAGILIDQVLDFFQTKSLLKKLDKQIFGKASSING